LRNSSDDFYGEINWKPVRDTTLSYEEQIDHIKIDSYLTLAPSNFLVQEANGAPAAPGGWDSYTPYGISSCNTNSMGTAYTNATTYTILSPPQSPGGLPIINPACRCRYELPALAADAHSLPHRDFPVSKRTRQKYRDERECALHQR
jgi:hypothetical protein